MSLEDIATITGLPGLDPLLKLISMTVKAASTARAFKRNCKRYAQHLELLGGLLEKLRFSELRKDREARAVLEGLDAAVLRGYGLVSSCQDLSWIYTLAMGQKMLDRFRESEEDIDKCLLLVPLIAIACNNPGEEKKREEQSPCAKGKKKNNNEQKEVTKTLTSVYEDEVQPPSDMVKKKKHIEQKEVTEVLALVYKGEEQPPLDMVKKKNHNELKEVTDALVPVYEGKEQPPCDMVKKKKRNEEKEVTEALAPVYESEEQPPCDMVKKKKHNEEKEVTEALAPVYKSEEQPPRDMVKKKKRKEQKEVMEALAPVYEGEVQPPHDIVKKKKRNEQKEVTEILMPVYKGEEQPPRDMVKKKKCNKQKKAEEPPRDLAEKNEKYREQQQAAEASAPAVAANMDASGEPPANDKENDKGKVIAVLKVCCPCDGCQQRCRSSLRGYPGVEGVAMQVDEGTMTVVGRFDAKKLRDHVANKTGKKVDLVGNNNEKSVVPVVGTVVLKIGSRGLHCDGCMKSIREKLFEIGGVEQVRMDMDTNQVTVTGTMDMNALPEELIIKIKRPVEVVLPRIKDKDDKD